MMLFQSVESLSAQSEPRSAKEATGLIVGDTVPDFSAINQDGELLSLHELLKNGPVVVIFYRGHWCPVCNRHLEELEKNLTSIYDKGAQLIAVSPEKQENLSKTKDKTNASFHLLYDEHYKIADLFDLRFLPSTSERAMYNLALSANLKEAHSDNSQQLPIPATYIINQEGEIVWRHFNPDYKDRSKVEDILENLP